MYKRVYETFYLYYNEVMCTAKSINLLEYPYSLSYQEIILKNVEFNPIPPCASITDVLGSDTKS